MSSQNQLETILTEGIEMLGLDLAIISNINGETYKVHSCKSSDSTIKPGDIFGLSQTYCSDVIFEKNTKHYKDVAVISEMLKHPCYLNTQLRAYIGTPVFVNGEIWGTLNYSSLLPRASEYSETEIQFLKEQAKKVGEILEAKE